MTDEELLQYLKDTLKKYTEMDMVDFWAFPHHDDFKPLKLTEKEIIDKVSNKINHYKGKKVCNIRLVIKDRKSAISGSDSLVIAFVLMFKITDKGIDFDRGVRSLKVSYYKEDLVKRKFRTKDLFKYMKYLYNDIMQSDPINGKKFTTVVKQLKEKGIDFHDDIV